MTPYAAYPDIQGIIYQDDMDINCLMRTDELYKFSDGTLNHVRTALNDIATGIQMEYLPKRKWTKQDKQRARVMINAIDKKLKDRRLMRSLEMTNLVDPHRFEGYLKMEVKVPDSSSLTRFITTCSYPTDNHKDIMKSQVHVQDFCYSDTVRLS
ncbi:hypothetical protein Tco_1045005 [Tanacetum coccineum]|uniref:Uncharacterized protein n=1 Tax=Tanacetum coccineum TaxID=301880 RepID=A0ABQ5GSB9_9ASTR